MATMSSAVDTAGAWLKKSFASGDITGNDLGPIKTILSGKKALASNEAINSITGMSQAKGFMGGIGASYKNIANNKMGVMDGIKAAHMRGDGTYNLGAIAGSYIGVSAAARIAGGGGAYRDRSGNANLIGVPFI